MLLLNLKVFRISSEEEETRTDKFAEDMIDYFA